MGIDGDVPAPVEIEAFIAAIENDTRRRDALALTGLMTRVTGVPAAMWDRIIIGFGINHYRYESGREGDQPAVGFSPQKGRLSLYGLINSPAARYRLGSLGKHTTGVGCLYINKLSDVDMLVLEELIREGFATMNTGPAGAQT